jgi:hypothetical protein
MSSLKDILGSDYNEKETVAELEAKIASKGLKLADLSKGDYVDKQKYGEIESKYSDLSAKYSAKLTDAEKLMETQKANQMELSRYRFKDKLGKTIDNEDTRNAIADLYAQGKTDEAIEMTNKFFTEKTVNMQKAIEEAKLHKDPAPQNAGGNGNPSITQKQFQSMSLAERSNIAKTQPDVYNQLTGKE